MRHLGTVREEIGMMSPRSSKFNKRLRHKISSINRSQAVFISRAKQLDAITGESFGKQLEDNLKQRKLDTKTFDFDPSNFEFVED